MTMTWQPIETAPKDATKILVYDRIGQTIFAAEWVHSLWMADKDHLEVDCNGYCYGGRVSDTRNQERDVTHWMPLPEPPKEKS